MATVISRRVISTLGALDRKDYEEALIHLFPAIDKTAKKRRNKGVGERIKGFISDEEKLISAIATGNIFSNISVNGVDFPTALYKFGRTSIAHEGELDERLTINDNSVLQIGHVWNLPSSYITALLISVIVAPENKGERIPMGIEFSVFDQKFKVNEAFGERDKIHQLICKKFKNPKIFEN